MNNENTLSTKDNDCRRQSYVKNCAKRHRTRQIKEKEKSNVCTRDANRSLELCAGSACLSKSFKCEGMLTTTVDHDPSKSPDLVKSLRQIVVDIESKNLSKALDVNFDVIWAAPECRTWSKAAAGLYRNAENIDGFIDNNYGKAHAAKQEIIDLVKICNFYRSRNPSVLLCIENPVGYLDKHPISDKFQNDLQLHKVKLSYCHFPVSTLKPSPQKNTNLWTNSVKVIETFIDESYLCRNDCNAMDESGKKHLLGVCNFPNNHAAYPIKLCELWAKLLAGELRYIKRK